MYTYTERGRTYPFRPVFVAGIAYIVYDALLPRRPGTDRYQHAVNWVLASRPLYFLAQVSYGVYLYHLFFADIYLLLKEPIATGAVAFVPHAVDLPRVCTLHVGAGNRGLGRRLLFG